MFKFEDRQAVVLENNGQKLFGIIHRPNITGRVPAVMFCHGFGGNKAGRFRVYVHLAVQLVKMGIAVLRLDFRGCGDSEGDFSEISLTTQLEDVMKGLDFLEKDPQIDPARIGIFGRSLGGVIALLSAAQFGHIQSIAVWAPVFSGDQWQEQWRLVKENVLSREQLEQILRINGQLANLEFLAQLFALDMKKELESLHDIPFMHIHGELDYMVTTQHAEGYFESRKHAIAETKFIRLPQSDHDFSHPDEQRFAIEETAKWFEKTL